MSARQRRDIPAAGIRAVVLELDRARGVVRWAETETISVEHHPALDLACEVAGDRLVIGSASPAGGGERRLRVSDQGIVVRLGDRGGISIGPQGIELEGLGLGRRTSTPAGASLSPLVLTVPLALRHVTVTIGHGALRLEGPRGRVEASLGDGELTIDDGEGQLSVETVSGHVSVDRFSGALEVTSGSGDVVLRGVTGAVAVKSGSGDVVVRDGTGELAVTSGSGDVDVVDCTCPVLSVKAGSGRVSVSGGAVATTTVKAGSGDVSFQAGFGLGRHEFATGSGDLVIAFPPGLPARIEVTTRGDVESSLPLVAVGQRGPRSAFGRRLVGSVGEGSGPRAEVVLRSQQGDVRLHWLSTVASTGYVRAGAPTLPAVPDEPPVSPPVGTAGTDEAQAVLEALAQGEITVEEAQFLLDRLLR